MTVRKYRYIAFKYDFENNTKVDLEPVIVTIIKDKVAVNYGINVLYRLHSLALLQHLKENSVFVIRVDRDVCKYILFSILSTGELSSIKCNFKILFVSGILKKILKRLLVSLQN